MSIESQIVVKMEKHTSKNPTTYHAIAREFGMETNDCRQMREILSGIRQSGMAPIFGDPGAGYYMLRTQAEYEHAYNYYLGLETSARSNRKGIEKAWLARNGQQCMNTPSDQEPAAELKIEANSDEVALSPEEFTARLKEIRKKLTSAPAPARPFVGSYK